MRRPPLVLIPLFFSLALPAAAHAQEQTRADPTGDLVMIGAGPAIIPDYEGSNDYGIYPVPGAVGRVSGYSFVFLGNKFSVDLLRDKPDQSWDIELGPDIGLGLNRRRHGGIKDSRVLALHTVGTAVNLGGYVGVVKQGVVTSAYDRLSVNLSVDHDVAGAHAGTTITPAINYMTPLSRKAMVGIVASAVHADDNYANAYFSISPAESIASTLPAFNAKGGWKNWSVGAATDISLTGDLTGGLSVIGGVMYTRLLNDFAASPVTSIAGSRDQWMAGLGLAFTF